MFRNYLSLLVTPQDRVELGTKPFRKVGGNQGIIRDMILSEPIRDVYTQNIIIETKFKVLKRHIKKLKLCSLLTLWI